MFDENALLFVVPIIRRARALLPPLYDPLQKTKASIRTTETITTTIKNKA